MTRHQELMTVILCDFVNLSLKICFQCPQFSKTMSKVFSENFNDLLTKSSYSMVISSPFNDDINGGFTEYKNAKEVDFCSGLVHEGLFLGVRISRE